VHRLGVMMVSVRSYLSAGLAAGLLTAAAGSVALAPVNAPPLPALASPAVQLRAAIAALPLPAAALPSIPDPIDVGSAGSAGDVIINGYNAIEPWVQYSVELGAWAIGWLPWPIGLAAPQMNIAYSGIEPVTQALVYSTAYLIDGEFDLIGPTITNGIQTGVDNFIQGEISWFASFFPPLPPIQFPVLPGAATAPADAGRTEAPAPKAAATRSTPPAEPAPVDSVPVESVPVEPVESVPVESVPVEPVESVPVESVQSMIVESVQAEAKIDLAAEPAAPTTRSTGRTPRSAPTPDPAAMFDAATATEAPSDPAAESPANTRRGGGAKAARGAR
jgi:hypothetical protein